MAERDEFGAFLIGFIIGGLTGAAISLLMAPQSGEETREYLKDQAIVLRDKAQDTAQTTASQVNTRAAEVRTRAAEIAEKAKVSANELAQKGQVVLEEQKNKIAQLRGTHSQNEETAI